MKVVTVEQNKLGVKCYENVPQVRSYLEIKRPKELSAAGAVDMKRSEELVSTLSTSIVDA